MPIAIVLTLFCSRGVSPYGGVTPLCDALSTVRTGERKGVTVSGLYTAGPEQRVLYAADCARNLQPATVVVLAGDSVHIDAVLSEALRQTGVAAVVVEGDLYGGHLVASIPTLPRNVDVMQQLANSRYGPGRFRTQLVITRVVSAIPAPMKLLANVALEQSSTVGSVPVMSTAIPQYPSLARRAGIAGDVELRIIVRDGAVGTADIISGDEILATAAAATIKTWVFPSTMRATFNSTFSYRLERRELTDNQRPRIEMDLPFRVSIVVPIDDW